MDKQETILKLMDTARQLERGHLHPEGAEADFSAILDEYSQPATAGIEREALNTDFVKVIDGIEEDECTECGNIKCICW